MKIRIDGTQNVLELNLFDPYTGVNWVCDYIALVAPSTRPDEFRIDPTSDDQWISSLETYQWWADHLEARQAVDYRRYELVMDLGISRDAVDRALEDIACDIEDWPGEASKALDQLTADGLED